MTTDTAQVTLNGKGYNRIKNPSFGHDIFVMSIVRKHSLDRLQMFEGESPEEFADRVVQVALSSGSAMDLIGGLLIPEGITMEDWTEKVGRDTAIELSRLTSPDDKAMLRAELAQTMAFFLLSGIASLRTSRKSSTSPARTSAEEPASPEAPATTTTGT
jgi:hypothetical protein